LTLILAYWPAPSLKTMRRADRTSSVPWAETVALRVGTAPGAVVQGDFLTIADAAIVGEQERFELGAADGPEPARSPRAACARARSEGEWCSQKSRRKWRRYWLLALPAVTPEKLSE
jgi:hypothetical protein